MDTYCVCVHSGSGAMGEISKTVAAVVSVAIVLYCSPCLMSHMWVLLPSVPCPRPCPVKTLTFVYVGIPVMSDLMCVSSV